MAASVPPAALNRTQLRALFDILSHSETYAEVEAFRSPDTVENYGYPFSSTTRLPVSAGGDLTAASSLGPSPPGTPRTRTPAPPEDKDQGKVEGAEERASNGGNDIDRPSGSPLLQTLWIRVVLPLPGLKDLPPEFWSERIQAVLALLARADLSESYDKGGLGTRKTLATGAAAVIEMAGRGALGGVRAQTAQERAARRAGGDKASAKTKRRGYDRTKADELERAWEDCMDDLVHGKLMDDVFDHFGKTDDIEGYSPAVKAAAEYCIIHLAAFLHHIFVLSPEGQYLLKLLENVHGLVPYKMVKQTLRMGNAATMINGMTRLLLAKLSVASITNWVGLTSNADDGMNLLQRIISLVLSWDAGEFKKTADKVEKTKDASERPSDDVLAAIRQYVSDCDPEQRVAIRAVSKEVPQSIVTAILAASPDPALAGSLTPAQHTHCLEYLSALLSARDRDAITNVLCKQHPDLFTQAVRDGVAAYEPMIRAIHSTVDIREYVEIMQGFIDDFIRASKPKKASGSDGGKDMQPAGVDDYVALLMKNRGLSYKWIHGLAAGCPDVWADFRAWAKTMISRFRQAQGTKGEEISNMDERLNELFASLPEESRGAVLTSIDAHASYLDSLASLSRARLQTLLDDTPSSSVIIGPGAYLARWQDLLDATAITPAAPKGEAPRSGRDVKHATVMGKIGVATGGGTSAMEKARAADDGEGGKPAPPDVTPVVRALGEGFKGVVQQVGGPPRD